MAVCVLLVRHRREAVLETGDGVTASWIAVGVVLDYAGAAVAPAIDFVGHGFTSKPLHGPDTKQ